MGARLRAGTAAVLAALAGSVVLISSQLPSTGEPGTVRVSFQPPPASLDELWAASPLVVTGTVGGVTAVRPWRSGGATGSIVERRFRVRDVLRSDARVTGSGDISIVQRGGTIEIAGRTETTIAPDMPALDEGDEAVLFLTFQSVARGYVYEPAGLFRVSGADVHVPEAARRILPFRSRAQIGRAEFFGWLAALGEAERRARPSLAALVDQFRNAPYFFQQFDVGLRLIERGDREALALLAPWLSHDDRHIRGNVAFIFASFGDPRGFETIVAILGDRSERTGGQGIPGGRPSSARQIESDRYYAVHLLGLLRQARAVDVLVSLLDDDAVNDKAAWALGLLSDERAIVPLTRALQAPDPTMRIVAIGALEALHATGAIPAIRALANDPAFGSGDRISVGDTARVAIANMQRRP